MGWKLREIRPGESEAFEGSGTYSKRNLGVQNAKVPRANLDQYV